MAVPLEAFQAALPGLQDVYDRQVGVFPYKLEIKPISGTDIYYSDGDARNWTGKIVFLNPKTGLDDNQLFFANSGIVRALRSDSLNPFNTWVKSVVDTYWSKQTPQK